MDPEARNTVGKLGYRGQQNTGNKLTFYHDIDKFIFFAVDNSD